MKHVLAPLAAFAIMLFVFNAAEVQAADATQIEVCCAWGTDLSEGVLTYKIAGGDATIQATIEDAVEDWDTTLPGLTLTRIFGNDKADITIRFKKGGGPVQGLTLTKLDRFGFITSANVNVSGMAFGIDIGAVHQIALHEMGHALGAGHADGDGVLMATTITGGVDAITQCDEDAVVAANHWKLVDGATTPHQPHVSSVSCP